MQLGKLWVYHLQVGGRATSRAAGIEGGQLDLTDEIRSIFEPAFLGKEKRPPARQPFHFNLSGKIRSNSTREHVLSILEEGNPEAERHCEVLAGELKNLMDDRIGDLLFTVAVGWEEQIQRCALWVYPSENPIRFFSRQGKPMVEELRRAFSRKSHYRKAVFFEGPRKVTRNDFLRGEIVDATRQGKSRSVAHYWVEKFLHGQIELKAARGVLYLVRALKEAQKAAQTVDEKASVIAAFNHLLAGTLETITLSKFSTTLKGAAKEAYLAGIPTTIEKYAVFELDATEVRKRVTQVVYVLENAVEVIFPTDESVDPQDFLVERDGKTFLRLELPVERRYFG
jgi:hypothetical protein